MSLQVFEDGYLRTRWHSIRQQTRLAANPKSTASHSEREAGDIHAATQHRSAAVFGAAGQRRSRGPENLILASKLAPPEAQGSPYAGDLRRAAGSPARFSVTILKATTATPGAHEV